MSSNNLSAEPHCVKTVSEGKSVQTNQTIVEKCRDAEAANALMLGKPVGGGVSAGAVFCASTPVLLHGSSKSVLVEQVQSQSPLSLDWLRWSATGLTPEKKQEIVEALEWLEIGFDRKAILGYEGHTAAFAGFLGFRLDGMKRWEMLVDLPGEAVRYLRESGRGDLTILKDFLSIPQGHFTRVDAARDIIGSGVPNLDPIHEKCKAHQRYLNGERQTTPIACRAKGNGEKKKLFFTAFAPMFCETLHIGSRKSARFLKIYMKTLEQKRRGVLRVTEDWIRIEMTFGAGSVSGRSKRCANTLYHWRVVWLGPGRSRAIRLRCSTLPSEERDTFDCKTNSTDDAARQGLTLDCYARTMKKGSVFKRRRRASSFRSMTLSRLSGLLPVIFSTWSRKMRYWAVVMTPEIQ